MQKKLQLEMWCCVLQQGGRGDDVQNIILETFEGKKPPNNNTVLLFSNISESTPHTLSAAFNFYCTWQW